MVVVGHLLRQARRTEEQMRLLRDELARLREAVEKLEGFRVDGVRDMVRHSDALFALLDQKLDRYRRQSDELRRRLEGPEGGEDPGAAD
jgi:ribosomal protein S2